MGVGGHDDLEKLTLVKSFFSSLLGGDLDGGFWMGTWSVGD